MRPDGLLRRARLLAYRLLGRLGARVFPETTEPDRMWQRIALNRAVSAYIDELGPETLSAAEISGASHAHRPWKQFASLNYPDFDLCAELETERRFDVVICEQVLEHVVDPVAAAANLRRLARPGGRVVVSTPFMVRVHELPMYGMRDYWRFTPRGLAVLLEHVGLEVEGQGSWGNRECLIGNLDRWSEAKPWHPMHNEIEIPLQVWAFAKNPG